MPAFAWALLLMVASYVIQSIVMKPQTQAPAGLEEFDFPQAEEGTPEAIFFGDNWTKGFQVLWYGNMRTKKIKSKGKK